MKKKKVKKEPAKVCVNCIVKRKGRTEEFDERKVYASCYYACLSTQIEHHSAEKVCEKVSAAVKAWAVKKKEINSGELFRKIADEVRKQDKYASFMYEMHREIS